MERYVSVHQLFVCCFFVLFCFLLVICFFKCVSAMECPQGHVSKYQGAHTHIHTKDTKYTHTLCMCSQGCSIGGGGGGGLPGCTVVHLDAGSFRVHKSAAREDAVSKWNPVVLDSCGTRSVRSSFQDTIMSITLYHNMTQSHCPTFWSRYLNMTLSHCLHYGLDLLT